LGSHLGQPAEQGHTVPLRALLLLTALAILPVLGRRDAEIGDRGARRHRSRLRIRAEIADNDDLVDPARHDPRPFIGLKAGIVAARPAAVSAGARWIHAEMALADRICPRLRRMMS